MKCTYAEVDGRPAILCGGRRFDARRCACGTIATKLCDWILERGKPGLPTPKTCDEPICEAHATNVDHNKDLCVKHRAKWILHPRHPKQQEGTPE